MKYFAYGSNMHLTRLRHRAPSSEFLYCGKLIGYTLKFHKKSKDGSGKCNAFHTGEAEDFVVGAVFEIAIKEKPLLDVAEGLGRGYNEGTVKVVGGHDEVQAFTYLADKTAIDDNLRPYTWYKEIVILGARYISLPDEYISRIEAVPAKEDPNPDRVKKNILLLKILRAANISESR